MPLMTVLKSTNVCMLIFLARKFMVFITFLKLMLTEIPPSVALSTLRIFMTLNFYNNLLRYHCYVNLAERELRARDN